MCLLVVYRNTIHFFLDVYFVSCSLAEFTYKFFFLGGLHWVFVAACGLSVVAASRGYSSLQCVGFSLWWLLLLWGTGSRSADFSSCGAWAQQSWHTGLVAPWHVGSSWTRDRSCVPCIGKQILNHCATREVPYLTVLSVCFSCCCQILRDFLCRQSCHLQIATVLFLLF